MPGNYCPVIVPFDSRAMTIVGVGAAGIDTSGRPVSFDGPESSAAGTPDVEADEAPLAFGTVPTNDPAELSTSIFNAGSDHFGISGVSVTGSGFSLATNGDGCTYSTLINEVSGSCSVSVSAARATQVPISGTLTIHTTAGDLDIPLSATGGPPLTAPGVPTGLHGTAGDKKVTLIWTAPSDDGGQSIEEYHYRYSTDGGSTWSSPDDAFDTTIAIKHLKDGKTYVFEVSADNGFLVSGYSAMSAPLSPHGPTDPSALTAPATTTITYGKSTTLSATLTDSSTSADLTKASLTLLARAAGRGAFKSVATATTNSHGVAQTSAHPHADTHYKWSYAGASGHSAITSNAGTVSVAQRVDAALSKSSVKSGKTTKVYGTVSPDETGRTVSLEELVSGKWKSLGITTKISLQKLPNHKTVTGYVLSYTSKKKGTETLRVSRTSTATNAAGESSRLTLKVT